MIGSEAVARDWLRDSWGVDALGRLDTLVDLLVAENGAQNLIAAATIPAIFRRHIADSAQLLSLVPRGTPGDWLDLGSGAGFPGLVVALLDPERPVLVVESRARRVSWLQRAAGALALRNVEVIGLRLEDMAPRPIGIISARAFAPLAKTLDLASRFSTAETLWLLPKGRSAQQELTSVGSRGAMFHVEQSLTDPEAGIIIGHLAGKRGGKP